MGESVDFIAYIYHKPSWKINLVGSESAVILCAIMTRGIDLN